MNYKRKNLKQLLAMMMVMLMVCTSISFMPVQAEETKKDLQENVSVSPEVSGEPSTIDEKLDSDKDGLADFHEKYFGTDPQKPDTDEDGLSDYIEIILVLNPLAKDTDGNGIEDGLEDADHDGLSNLDEKAAGTDSAKKDTDGDGLSDGQEVKIYHTSPILGDTDGDTLTDGDETLLKLNPLKAFSNEAIHDSKRKIQQSLSSKRIADSLKKSTNLFVPSLSGAVSGVMDKNVFMDKYDNDGFSKNHAIIGEPIQIKASSKKDNQLLLSLDYSSFLNSKDESALDTLTICEFANNEFIPLETKKDKNDKSLKADISGEGIYFVLDVEKFLDSIAANQDETTVLLSDFQYVKLKDKVSETNNIDTDGDSISDYKELGKKTVKDMTPFINLMQKKKGVKEDSYAGITSVTTYAYLSNPILPDTDYDGREDSIDAYPLDNSFSGVLYTAYADSNVSYVMDYRNFFKSNTSYSAAVGTIASLYSSVIYHENTYSYMDIKTFMESNGIYDVVRYDFTSTYSDSDVSEAYIGHRRVEYAGETKEIVTIVVRGTNGTIKEWTSNFDIGTTAQKYKYPDWVVTSNHKGFDIAATRILKYLQQYEGLGYLDTTVPRVYWVMGHSRGAAIANIIGARLIDQSKYVYTYTFAAPNTTTSYYAGSYAGIYNILNTDDFVPYLPMAEWGFTHYGKSVSISIADNYETEWEDLTGCTNSFGIVDYNPDTIGMDDTLNTIAAIVNYRNECYIYTCDDHGDGSLDNITIRNYGTSYSSREEAIAKIPSNALPYCIITRYNGGWFWGWDFEVCQQPEYFMQVLAAYMAGTISETRFVNELNIADRYEAAKTAIIRSGLGGLEHPHYTESYYLLSTHVDSSSFQ